jgi:glycerate kinase
MPLSDGGEGFSECLAGCLGGVFRTVSVHDPLGRPVDARYALLEDGRIAVIETAAASGLTLLKPEELDPLNASSIGTGELMQDAVQQGVKEIWFLRIIFWIRITLILYLYVAFLFRMHTEHLFYSCQ